MITLVEFQRAAVEKLTDVFIRLWSSSERQLPIVFKSPTGSGKTLVMANFVRDLNHRPNWDGDKAFIWITFSDELAMQSKEKFRQYFEAILENELLTVSDLDRGMLHKNDILFLNWQKVVSRAAENRVLRRPDDESLRRESGVYFEDFIDATKVAGREIVLIIDEAHTNVTADLAQQVIDYISPKIVVHVSATPKAESVALAAEIGSFILVDRQSVVDAGLIKHRVISQTSEDFLKVKAQDFDHKLLEIGLAKRKEIADQMFAIGSKVNPLLLVQLPNDDSLLLKAGEKSKEQVVSDYLESIGYDMTRVAKWFDSHSKPVGLEHNESNYDILLFKLAAGTGWDCPRAHVLVMYRNIRVEQRYIQTIGRILRTAEPERALDYAGNPLLCSGFLYTNYGRADITENWFEPGSSRPQNNISYRKIGINNVKFPTQLYSRVDYGDLGSSVKFQTSFCGSMNRFFQISDTDNLISIESKLRNAGLDLAPNLTSEILVDLELSDFDHLNLDFKRSGGQVSMPVSRNDVEKIFTSFCWMLLTEQTEEDAKISNISRSWSPLKSAIRVWLKGVLGPDSDSVYRVFIFDVQKGATSVFRHAITFALKEYRPVLNAILASRTVSAKAKDERDFEIQEFYAFPEDYSVSKVQCYVLDKFLIPTENYLGKKNEMDFVKYLESKRSVIEWWFKQAIGQEYLAIRYVNTSTNKVSLFYPDWIVKFKDGRVGIFDTKSGQTAINTEGRAEALAQRMNIFGKKSFGGILVCEGKTWHLNSSSSYSYAPGQLSKDWKPLEKFFK